MLGIPDSYIYRNEALVSRDWLRDFVLRKSPPDVFPELSDFNADDITDALRLHDPPDNAGWTIISIKKIARKRKIVCPLPKSSQYQPSEDQSFAEVLKYVSTSNFSNEWKDAFKNWSVFSSSTDAPSKLSFGLEHDVVVLEVLKRLHPESPILSDWGIDQETVKSLCREPKEPSDCVGHIKPAVAIVIGRENFYVLSHSSKITLHDALTFSPAFFQTAQRTNLLFVTFQIIQFFREVHCLGLCVGDISHCDFSLTNELFVTAEPKATDSIFDIIIDDKTKEEKQLLDLPSDLFSSLKKTLMERLTRSGETEADTYLSEFMSKILNAWVNGHISNFNYLLLLNYLSGRTFDNPNNYPVMPWVRDFSSETGGWRDLSKSKFRLNKGDTQLDLTFDSLTELSKSSATHYGLLEKRPSVEALPASLSGSQTVPVAHHVTDVLSNITYYVYKARITSRSVLCKHVRRRWVPAEYPSSMLRLQAWTPDECIPDFFTDPNIFKSIHSDLEDLQIPKFCKTPEEFISWHMNCLESQYVSERLHYWIDLTFGFKLSGASAVKAKNVCLHLVDGHRDLRNSGVVQLFTQPHPSRQKFNQYWNKTAPRLDQFFAKSSLFSFPKKQNQDDSVFTDSGRSKSKNSLIESETASSNKTIKLPLDFDPLLKLNEVEAKLSFMASITTDIPESRREDLTTVNIAKLMSHRKIVRDMQVLGCLIMELFLPKKFVTLGKHASLKSRMEVCKSIIRNDLSSIPLCIKETVLTLIRPDFQTDLGDRFPSVSEAGLPPPSPFQLLLPQTSSLSFPSYFHALSKCLCLVEELANLLQDRNLPPDVQQRVSEFKVKYVARTLETHLTQLPEGAIDLIVPLIKKLFSNSFTSIYSAWYLFDPIAKQLGPMMATRHLLGPTLKIYETDCQTSKHLKLYHRSFLQFLIVRFGTQVFLRYFTTVLIEAVGGYRDYQETRGNKTRECLERTWTAENLDDAEPEVGDSSSSMSDVEEEAPKSKLEQRSSVEEHFAEGEVFSFDNVSLKDQDTLSSEGIQISFREGEGQIDQRMIYIPPPVTLASESPSIFFENMGNISQVASESVLWLAHRIGPVLTAKFITRNLLRMLSLCYASPDCVTDIAEDTFIDQKIRISPKRLYGDQIAQKVLDCLSDIACLYGDHIIILQYLPFIHDLMSMCKKKITSKLEGGLLGSLALLHHIIPYLSDSLLMKELPDNILANILFPILQIISSRSFLFPGGYKLRQVITHKFLDVTYLIGLRIGEEMSRNHLTQLCVAFFSSFDKIYDRSGNKLEILDETKESKLISSELYQVMSPLMSYSAYVAFYNLMGRAHLDSCIINFDLIKTLCIKQQETGETPPRPATFTCLRGTLSTGDPQHDSSPLSSESYGAGGNKVDIVGSSSNALGSLVSKGNDNFLHSLIAKDVNASTQRHLKGNWLALWEHEIGRGEKDFQFNVKQIRLQSFAGHSASVKSLFVLDNENSFLSGSRDRTVKVWSLRSQGDGNAAVGCQWTYGQHKKSVFATRFLEGIRLAASCDSTIHLWDPFVGSGVHQVDTQRIGPVHAMTTMAPPSSLVVAVTNDSSVHFIDSRTGSVVQVMKVPVGITGLVRTVTSTPDGKTILAGHGSGFISLLDPYCGRIRHFWKAHEGEVLHLLPLGNSEILSSSLDQTVNIWQSNEGQLKCSLTGVQEPVHCTSYIGDSNDIIIGTTSNRIGVRHGTNSESPLQFTKLRTEIVKGNLTSMQVLGMNRMLLIGQDNGNLILMA